MEIAKKKKTSSSGELLSESFKSVAQDVPEIFEEEHLGGGGGGGGFRLNPHIEVRFKWMWFPIGIFQSPNFSLREGSKKKFDTASSRGLP